MLGTASVTIVPVVVLGWLFRLGFAYLPWIIPRYVILSLSLAFSTLVRLLMNHVLTFYLYSCWHCLNGPDGAATSQDGRGSGEEE
jgi:hypothetical protein